MRSPEATAASRACSPTPSVDAARRTTASSPVSSAAASSSSDCTGGGSSRLRSRKACSTRVVRCSCAGSGEDPPSWSGLSSVGSSSSASGFPPLSVDQPFGDLRRRCVAQALVEELAGRSRDRARPAQLGDAVGAERCRGPVAGREHQEHAVRTEPARAEQQRVRGRGVEPVRVLDDAQHGALLGGRGQHRQRRDRDQERLDRGPVLLAERDTQRPGLRGGEVRRAAASPGAAADAAPRTPGAPRPRGPGCAAPAPRRRVATSSSSRADLPTPGSPRTTRLPETRDEPAREARPGARSRGHGRLARCDRTTARTGQPPGKPGSLTGASAAERRARLEQPHARTHRPDRSGHIRHHARRHPHATPTSPRHRERRGHVRAAPHRAAALRRGRGAGRRRPLGGPRLLDAAPPRGRLGHLVPVRRRRRTSSARRTSSWVPTTPSTMHPPSTS